MRPLYSIEYIYSIQEATCLILKEVLHTHLVHPLSKLQWHVYQQIFKYFFFYHCLYQVVSNKTVMRDQVTGRGGQLKVKYLYEDSTNNRKINAITTATTQNSGTTGQMPSKPAPVSSLSKERSVDR